MHSDFCAYLVGTVQFFAMHLQESERLVNLYVMM